MKLTIYFALIFNMAFANLNPYVVHNTKSLHGGHTSIITLPAKQIKYASQRNDISYHLNTIKPIRVLIAPYETFSMITKDEKARFTVEKSLDGRLFQKVNFDRDKKDTYTYLNKHDQVIALKIYTTVDTHVSLYTTYNTSPLNRYQPEEISLPGEEKGIVSFPGFTASLYDHFEPRSHFSFQTKGPGTLVLSMRSEREALDDLIALRERISLRVNGGRVQILESLNRNSLSYIDGEENKQVSDETLHFISLSGEENNITVDTNGSIMLKASVYRDNLFNSHNDTNLSWQFSDHFERINDIRWRNSVRNDGLRRMQSILSQKSLVQDTIQQKKLQRTAKRSTFMKQLYPFGIPERLSKYTRKDKENLSEEYFQILEGYFSPYQLYTDNRRANIDFLQDDHLLRDIGRIDKGVFIDVPEEAHASEDIVYRREVKKVYIDPLQRDNDETLRYQVMDALKGLSPYSKIYISGCKGLKSCLSLKQMMVDSGIPANVIDIDSNTMPTQVYGLDVISIEATSMIEGTDKLEYRFSQPLDEEREFEITLLSMDDKQKQFYLALNGKERQVYTYEPDSYFDTSSFNSGVYAYSALKDRDRFDADKILAVLHASDGRHFYERTGTIKVVLPKGTQTIGFSRPVGTDPFKITLKMREKSIYKESAFSLASTYAGTYVKFANTLDRALSESKAFDSWYEHTHPLRLWFNGQIAQVKTKINTKSLVHNDIKELLEETTKYKNDFTTQQIAVHVLMSSKQRHMVRKALDVLLAHSEDNKQKLVWLATYFYKTKSLDTLGVIAELLYTEGQYRLALDTLLLIDRDKRANKLLTSLTLLENQFFLYRHLTQSSLKVDSEVFLRKKEQLLEEEHYKKQIWKKDIKVGRSAGYARVYINNRDITSTYYKATAKQGVEIEVEGPKVLKLDIRFSSLVDRYRWLKIVHGQDNYHYPVVNTMISPTLKNSNEDGAISIGNSLELVLGEGNHSLKLYGYEEPFLISVRSRDVDGEVVAPLYEQLLYTPHIGTKSRVKIKEGVNIPYVSSLLWRYGHGIVSDRYHVQAKATILKEYSKSRYLDKILDILRSDSSFRNYSSVNSELGFYEEEVPVWNPESTAQKSRVTLLEGIEDYDTVLYGNETRILHVEGDRNITWEVKQVHPNYFPYAPLHFLVQVDDKPASYVKLDKNMQSYKKELEFSEGSHSIKFRILSPILTHYLGINLYENGERMDQDQTRRYYIATKEQPVQLELKGPKLIRIDEKSSYGELLTYYRYYSNDRLYEDSFIPSKGERSMMRFSEMYFDPFKRDLNMLEKRPDDFITLSEKNFKVYDIDALIPAKSKTVDFQSLDPTWSFELGYRSVDLLSEDDVETSSEAVSQLGIYHRWKMDDDIYLKQHLFLRLYDNPLLAFKNKFYTKLPVEDLWMTSEINGYFQEANGYGYKNIHLGAEVFKKEPLAENVVHKYGIGAFKYFMDYQSIEPGIIDPLVYTEYKRSHQYGLIGKYAIFYYPYDDTMLSYKLQFRSNEALTVMDHIKNKFSLHHYFRPLDVNFYYENRHYFEDRDRLESYNISDIGGKVQYETLFDTQFLELEVGFKHRLENSETNFFLNVVWHHSRERERHHFMPEEKLFNGLRRLLEVKEGGEK